MTLSIVLLCPDTENALENEWSDWEKGEWVKFLAGLRAVPDSTLTIRTDHTAFFAELLAGAAERHRTRESRDAAGNELVVVNLLQEGVFNDPDLEMHVCAVLDVAGVAYTGAGPAANVVSLDKCLMAAVARDRGLRVPESLHIAATDDVAARIAAEPPTRFPVILKLSNAYSSLGLSEDPLAHDIETVVAKAQALRREFPTFGILAQEYVSGREFSVAVLGSALCSDLRTLPMLEIDFSGLNAAGKAPVQSHGQRLNNDSELNSRGVIRVDDSVLPAETIAAIEACVLEMAEAIGARDYARFDVRLDAENKVPYMLDANPNCWIGGKMAQMALWSGLDPAAFCAFIVKSALARHRAAAEKKRALEEAAAAK
jgi:D-alanine-D-alanine ligase-like ATP-grasp enzyme|eukprot:TRINITY_DN18036_c0_g1_i1.p1 TRINITY_DN18036_c0_g1~~TRINITY_DN18036_c0_g1_i1.p1  ORF type:complete len:371 (+),score=173.54 TRINITY_DN18036_c0_g1_i1:76-1188(+)